MKECAPLDAVTHEQRLERLRAILPRLTAGQLLIIERIVAIFGLPKVFKRLSTDFLTEEMLIEIGDALMVHHCFSSQPFTKDKFEYVLEAMFRAHQRMVELPRRTFPGYDLIVDGVRLSLKTQADRSLKPSLIHISKFMELGGIDYFGHSHT